MAPQSGEFRLVSLGFEQRDTGIMGRTHFRGNQHQERRGQDTSDSLSQRRPVGEGWGTWVPQGVPPFPEGQARGPPSPRLTNEQFTEEVSGLMVCSWYSILQTMITHVQTVPTLEARWWSLAYGRMKAQEIRNT